MTHNLTHSNKMFTLKKSPVEGERAMNFSFSSYSENYQDPGIGKWCWWRKAPVQVCLPQVRTRSEDDGDGCTVPRCPQRFRQPLLHEASVLWAVFPTILRAYYPRKVERKRQQQTGHGNWTGTLVQRDLEPGYQQGKMWSTLAFFPPLLFIFIYPWKTLNTVDPPYVTLVNWLQFTLGWVCFLDEHDQKNEVVLEDGIYYGAHS